MAQAVAVKVRAVPVEVEAFQFDGTDVGAKDLRDWARALGYEATLHPRKGSWNDQHPDAGVWVNEMPLTPGMWAVAGPVVQALTDEKFQQLYVVFGVVEHG